MGRSGRAGAIAGGLVLSLAALAPGRATAQPVAPAREAARPEGDVEGARAAFERLPAEDRIAIQDALVWTGDSASVADGTFGPRTFEAILSYQRRTRQAATGTLTRPALAALVAAAARVRDGTGFALQTDPATGIRIGIPVRLLPKRSVLSNGGTRYQSADERITLDMRTLAGDEDALRALYERNVAAASPGRIVSVRLLRPESFVVSGETASGRFFTRYGQRGGTLRGVSIGYDKATAATFDRVAVAIANSFDPFPAAEGTAAMAAAVPTPPLAASRAATGRPGQAFTGLAVGPRRILAPAAATEPCREPLVDGAPARIVAPDRAPGLVVLEPAAPRRAVPLAFGSAAPEGRGLVVFIASGEGDRVVAAPADLDGAGRLVAPLQDGAAGGVVLDAAGSVVGMVATLSAGRRAVAGLVPPASHSYAGPADLRRALGPDGPATPPPGDPLRSAGAAAAALAPALVRITCPAQRP